MTTAVDDIVIREPDRDDIPALARFAASMPAHDLLFLARDIRARKVLGAWLDAQESGDLDSLVAVVGHEIVATVAVVSDPLSWSSHVCDIRLLVSPDFRNRGLGRTLLERAMAIASRRGATRLTARLTPDQTGAITLFEESGFRAEALMRDHLRDAEGRLHDLAILAHDPARDQSIRATWGG